MTIIYIMSHSNEMRPKTEAQWSEIPTNNYIFSEVCDGVRGSGVSSLSLNIQTFLLSPHCSLSLLCFMMCLLSDLIHSPP